MSLASQTARAPFARPSRWAIAWAIALLLTVALYAAVEYLPWAAKYPRDWVVPLRVWISGFMKWLINSADLGLFTFKELTRSIAWLLTWPLEAADGLLASGFKLVFGADEDIVYRLPRLSWIAVVAVVAMLGAHARDKWLALLVGLCFLYLAVFGQWDSAMVTLSSIVVAVPLGVLGGLLVGIWGARSARTEAIITPVLDLMQTVPVFAYLVPVLFLFGFGPVAAMTATIIYAMPPMVRCTMLALKLVAAEIVEFGHMAGCSRRQLLWKVMIPSARPTLMVGVNQVIMLSLNMVIIASMIGAGGLGHDVLTSLRRLAIGDGLEAGIAITLLAIALDRLSQAFAAKPPPERRDPAAGFLKRHPHLAAAAAIIAVTTALGIVVPPIQSFPEAWSLTTGPFWDALVKWININFFDQLEAVKTFLLLNVLIPFKRFLLAIPWPAVICMLALAGWQLGGARLAALVAGLATFIVVTGNWEKAMISTYLVGISVAFASLIGMPIGIWAASNERVHRVVQVAIDTLQTLPAFVYLIPVVMPVPGWRLLGDDRGRDVFAGAGDPLHRPRHPPGAAVDHRGGDRGRLQPLAAAVEGRAAPRAARDHAGRQPDHHVRPLHAGHHGAGRHPRPGPGGLYRADQGGYRARPGGRRLRRLHRDDLRPADLGLEPPQETRAGP